MLPCIKKHKLIKIEYKHNDKCIRKRTRFKDDGTPYEDEEIFNWKTNGWLCDIENIQNREEYFNEAKTRIEEYFNNEKKRKDEA